MKSILRPFPGSKFRSVHPRPGKGSEAFSLVELIVGAAVSAVLIGSVGGLALVHEMRHNRDSVVNQSLRDSWTRTLAFISNEANQAYWIRTSITSPPGYPCQGSEPANPLVLDGPPNPANPSQPTWRVVYGIRGIGDNSTQWKGVNRLVRCGPPFEQIARSDVDPELREEALREAALGGNLSYSEDYRETTLTDQLPAIGDSSLPCPTVKYSPSPCRQPFFARVFNTKAPVDRDAQVNLFLRRRSGRSFPPAANSGFHVLIRANRYPIFDVAGNPNCTTSTDALGNQFPNSTAECIRSNVLDSTLRRNTVIQYNLSNASGSLRINGCGLNCTGPRVSEATEVIYFPGRFDDYGTKQFSATDTRPCSRKSCFIQGANHSVQIFDGDMLIFYDRIMRI
jgi:hypothetical protein